MFRVAVFHLAAPFCECEEKDITWEIYRNDSLHGLLLKCAICGRQEVVTPERFLARTEIDPTGVITGEDRIMLGDLGISPDAHLHSRK